MFRRLFLVGIPAALATPKAPWWRTGSNDGYPVCPYCHAGDCIGYDEDEICEQALAEAIEIFPTDLNANA